MSDQTHAVTAKTPAKKGGNKKAAAGKTAKKPAGNKKPVTAAKPRTRPAAGAKKVPAAKRTANANAKNVAKLAAAKVKAAAKALRQKKAKDPNRQASMKKNYHIIAWRKAASELGFLTKGAGQGFKIIPKRGTEVYDKVYSRKEEIYRDIIQNDPDAAQRERERLDRLENSVLRAREHARSVGVLA